MNNALGMLGLVMKSGRMQCGQSVCDKLIKSGEAQLILIDAGASQGTRKAVTDACAYYNIPFRLIPAGALGQAIGRSGRMVAAITDKALSARLIGMLQEAFTTID